MKKRNFNSLKLNKKSISNLKTDSLSGGTWRTLSCYVSYKHCETWEDCSPCHVPTPG
ncbi:hypothetical protein H2O64_08690 [Kordia sp. YSTF-M3]|uniref:Bacteriocin n=1 Tax=Kordia aestuariivivens TaxID=2759037 RepID=A0ABR7Q871_9FLAO|nr:hypothetical protein [Kordia aestuariivivens]MBC8754745.1 hypothetical protein [Kordia aestuariivivens]